jgi:hypothetical protein
MNFSDEDQQNLALSDCSWWDTTPLNRPWWARVDCSGRMTEVESGVLCEAHFNAHQKMLKDFQTLDKDESASQEPLNYLVCDECGEAFDVRGGLDAAVTHEFQDHRGEVLSGQHPLYTIKAESEAI